MKRPADAARLLRESNPVADDAFAGAAGDSLGRATFQRIIDLSPEPTQVVGRSPGWRRPFWLAVVAAGVAAMAVAAAVLPGALLSGAGGPVAYAANVVKGVNSCADQGRFRHVRPDDGHYQRRPDHRRQPEGAREAHDDDRRGVVLRRPVALGHELGGRASGLRRGIRPLIRLHPGQLPRRTWAARRRERAARLDRHSVHRAASGCPAGPVLFQPTLPATGLAPKSLLTVARTLRAAVSCGTLDVAARQRFDGVEAIKLTSGPNRPSSPRPSGSARARTCRCAWLSARSPAARWS